MTTEFIDRIDRGDFDCLLHTEDSFVDCILHSPHATIPSYATDHSACFDLSADLFDRNDILKTFHPANREERQVVLSHQIQYDRQGKKFIWIGPNEIVLVPTNIEFVLEVGYKMLIYPRSGKSVKSNLILANNVGVIDADYHLPVFLPILNRGEYSDRIYDGERLAQAEIVPARFFDRFNVVTERREMMEARPGGFGSTGNF